MAQRSLRDLFLDQLQAHRRDALPLVDGHIGEWAGTNLIQLSGGGKAGERPGAISATRAYLGTGAGPSE